VQVHGIFGHLLMSLEEQTPGRPVLAADHRPLTLKPKVAKIRLGGAADQTQEAGGGRQEMSKNTNLPPSLSFLVHDNSLTRER
jgi:hypothetical protein